MPRDWLDLIIAEGKYEYKEDKEFYFRFDNIVSPFRELVYYSYFSINQSIYYFEGLVKSPYPISKCFRTVTSMEQAKLINLSIQSYSFKKKFWVHSKFTLDKCVLTLIKENIIDETVLFNTNIKYSDLQLYTGILCRLIKFKDKKRNYKQKLLPKFEPEPAAAELDSVRQEHSASSIYEKDMMLYEVVMGHDPFCIASVWYNWLVEEYIIRLYFPRKGLVVRQPVSTTAVEAQVHFSQAMLHNQIKLELGKRVLQQFYHDALKNTQRSYALY